MKNTMKKLNNIGISSELDMPRIRHLMKIGLFAGVMVLVGDMLLGCFCFDWADEQERGSDYEGNGFDL